jgi:hypothetical protein
LSVKATPVRVLAAGLVTVKVSETGTFKGAVGAPNALVSVGGGVTAFRIADAVFPVPPLVELTVTLLVNVPTVFAVTCTVTVQVFAGGALAGSVPPVRDTVPEFAAAATVEPVPQLFVTPGVAATTRPVGNVSVKATPVSVLVPGLATTKANVLVPFSPIVVGPKALVIVGGPMTVKLAVALTVVVPVCVDVIELTVFVSVPATVPVTLTVTTQLLLLAIVPADSETLLEPAVAAGVPPQVFVSPGVVATTRFAGKLSVKATPVRVLAAGLVRVKVSETGTFAGVVGAPNALVSVGGGVAAIRIADVVFPVPPLVELTVTLLVNVLAVFAVTCTVTAQVFAGGELAESVPPVNDMLDEPEPAVVAPLQVLASPLGVATTSPAGSVSVKPTPV